ncbi:type II toxin-antitoxin system RelE/ParE family toxin [Polaribacter atrinae]|uniref:type II toxin-antitoxin system RelE/ParE family toxin n=1 Tax=Polaribacter atrinae TaxID=1333662 RepID=UPI0009EE3FEA
MLYLSNIEDLFFKLCKQPNLGRLRNDIKENLYSFPIQKHLVFYTIDINKLIIIRVLHGSRDMPKHLKPK